MIVTATVGAVSAVVFGVGAGTAGYVAVDGDGIHDWYRRGINDPHKASDLELGQSTLASHLPDMSAWKKTVPGETAAAQVSEGRAEVLICCSRKATRVPILTGRLFLLFCDTVAPLHTRRRWTQAWRAGRRARLRVHRAATRPRLQ